MIGAIAAIPSMAADHSLASVLEANDRIAHYSADSFAGDWPFKAQEGFFFCNRIGPFTYVIFHEYDDGPNKTGDSDLGFSLDTDAVSLLLEAVVQQKYLKTDRNPETLMQSVIELRKIGRELCGPPYAAEDKVRDDT